MNIIITGASRGIGTELTKLFAHQSGHTIFLISRNASRLESIVDECRILQPYSRIIAMPFDLEIIDEISSLYQIIQKEVDSIDILINNAGLLINKPFEELTPTDNKRMYNVNILAPMELVRSVMPLMLNSKNAHVVNISSMGGFQGSVKFSGLSSYASSKAAIAVLTECLAEEYKESVVRFNCLALGAVATEMLQEAFPGYEANTSAVEMATYIHDFAINGHKMFNGKILPVSSTTP